MVSIKVSLNTWVFDHYLFLFLICVGWALVIMKSDKILCLQLPLFAHLWGSWIGQRSRTTNFGRIRKNRKKNYIQTIPQVISPKRYYKNLTTQVVSLEQCHEEWNLGLRYQTMSWRIDILVIAPEQCYQGWHLRLWCQAMSWRIGISGHCSGEMLSRMISWVVVPSNVLKNWHLRSLLRVMSWKVASWGVVPSNAMKIDISGRCSRAMSLKVTFCGAIPSNVMKIDISSRCSQVMSLKVASQGVVPSNASRERDLD